MNFASSEGKLIPERRRLLFRKLTYLANDHMKANKTAVNISNYLINYAARHNVATTLHRGEARITCIGRVPGNPGSKNAQSYLTGFRYDTNCKNVNCL